MNLDNQNIKRQKMQEWFNINSLLTLPMPSDILIMCNIEEQN